MLTDINLGWHFVPRDVQHKPRPLPANKFSKPSQEWNNSALLGKNFSIFLLQKTQFIFQKILGILKKCKGAECNNVWSHILLIQKYKLVLSGANLSKSISILLGGNLVWFCLTCFLSLMFPIAQHSLRFYFIVCFHNLCEI